MDGYWIWVFRLVIGGLLVSENFGCCICVIWKNLNCVYEGEVVRVLMGKIMVEFLNVVYISKVGEVRVVLYFYFFKLKFGVLRFVGNKVVDVKDRIV